MDTRHFEVTDLMRLRFEERCVEYVSGIAEMWRDQGDDPESPEGQRALEHIARSVRVPERPEWMHPLDALAFVTSMDEDAGLSAEGRIEYLDALRTVWSMSAKECRKLLADAIGVTPQSIWDQYERWMTDSVVQRDKYRAKMPTALYRKYDSNGVLLYVGISMDLQNRDTVHGALSPWAKHVMSTSVEWMPDRASALAAETRAIADEDPIFNLSKSKRADPRKGQAEYLLMNAIK